jgi:MFS family permease
MTAAASLSDPTTLPHRYKPGSVQAAWSYRQFRLVWIGQVISNTGMWMQNVGLPAYIQTRFDSGTKVGLMVFAQLGPMLLLSVPGSVIANKFPRKQWLMVMPVIQMCAAFALAGLVSADGPFWSLFAANAVLGVANALNGPAFQGAIPLLVDRRDLPGAIALNSAQLNGSRIVGPLLAGVFLALGATVSQLILVNACTYPFVILAISLVAVPDRRGNAGEGWRQLTVGVRIAQRKPVLARLLIAMSLFAATSLAFIGLFPTVAEMAFGLEAQSASYSWLYATFGLGACLGGISVGTVLSSVDKRRVIAPAFFGFAVAELAFGLVSSPGPAFPVAFVVGAFYMLTTTSMVTVYQQEMADEERTFMMALWMMAFGGVIPIGNLILGPVIDKFGPRWVLGGGAAMAVFLGWWCSAPRLEADAALSPPRSRRRRARVPQPGSP